MVCMYFSWIFFLVVFPGAWCFVFVFCLQIRIKYSSHHELSTFLSPFFICTSRWLEPYQTSIKYTKIHSRFYILQISSIVLYIKMYILYKYRNTKAFCFIITIIHYYFVLAREIYLQIYTIYMIWHLEIGRIVVLYIYNSIWNGI